MWPSFRDFLVVTVVAMLVWLYAEGENVKEVALDMEIRFEPAASQPLSIKPRRLDHRVEATFRCNSVQRDQLKNVISRGPVVLELSRDAATPGDPRQEVDLRQKLAEHPLIQELGVGVVEVRPAKVVVTIERMETIRLPVAVVSPGDLLLENVTVDPQEVEIRLPASLAAGLGEAPRVETRLVAADLSKLPLNQPVTLNNVPLQPPLALRGNTADVEMARSTATVTLTIRKLAQTITLSSIPVRIVAPVAELPNYAVSLVDEQDQFVRNIKLTGPSTVMARIEAKELKVWADLKLEGDTLAKGASEETTIIVPHITAPPEVTADLPAPVRLRITRRE
jgi:hypothetical protein